MTLGEGISLRGKFTKHRPPEGLRESDYQPRANALDLAPTVKNDALPLFVDGNPDFHANRGGLFRHFTWNVVGGAPPGAG